jgi:hypothetical protein
VRKRGKRGAGGSSKPAGAWGEKERERGVGSGRGHAEKEGGGWCGREVGRRRGPARHGRGGSELLQQWRVVHASRARQERAVNRGSDGCERLTRGWLTGGARWSAAGSGRERARARWWRGRLQHVGLGRIVPSGAIQLGLSRNEVQPGSN